VTLSVREAAREFPDRVAFVEGGRETTFAVLAERVASRIAWLEPRLVAGGVAPFAMVGTSNPEMLDTVLSLIELGRPMALVHPRLTSEERAAVLAATGLGPLLTEAPVLGSAAAPAPTTEAAIDPERCLAILFTSGTTGRPKGIALSRRAFLASAVASEANLGWAEGDRWLLGLPIAHVGGLSVLTRCLLARRTVVVPREIALGSRLDSDALVRTIEDDRVTLASLVPTQLERLLRDRPSWRPPSGLRAVLLGGAAARPALLVP
jgi:O-succinylbenzoic acid--CoA ligase